ncbi:MAG: PD-(D/E)XK nuclease family protein, partial [Bacteroidota bacterium]
MQSFIGQLVDALLAQYPQDIGDIVIVFPSRRACVFFKDYLLKAIDKPMWAPAVYAIEDFVKEIHPNAILETVSLTFEFYPIYQTVFPNEPFDKFYSWGTMLISDFDEIDRYLVDAQEVFRNLFELKEIDTTIDSWLNEDGTPTEFQAKYLRFWELMGDFYEKLRKKLDVQGLSAPGQALRELAEQFAQQQPRLPWPHVVFAGFNALSPAEELLIKSLVGYDMASCYWDLDRYYVDDPYQEAGRFFREMRQRWEAEGKPQEWHWLGEGLASGEKEVVMTGVPLRVGQAKVAGLKLQEMLANDADPEKTAVVLPDENLLFPLLHSLPPALKDVNVTMGFPLRNTPLYSLVESIIQMHENADRLHPGRGKSSIYYFRDVQNILRHPYIRAIAFDESRELLLEINKENLVYIAPEYFENYEVGHILRFLFQVWEDIPQVITYYLELYQRLKVAFEGPGGKPRKVPAVETEYLFHFFTLTQKLRDKLDNYSLNFDLKIFRRLYKEVIQSGSIPFAGEPLRGLQVMGMLETRVLDFERLIILSVNEGILPSKPSTSSFIPYNLRRAFGLPTYEDKDAIYAYHFYRLLQRAQHITLIYNTENDTFGSGEKSRFVSQLEAELPRRNPNVSFARETVTFPAEKEPIVPIIVDKTPELLAQLKEFAQEKGFSPSALSTYLNCPLQFYYRYLMRLYEQDEPEENM